MPDLQTKELKGDNPMTLLLTTLAIIIGTILTVLITVYALLVFVLLKGWRK